MANKSLEVKAEDAAAALEVSRATVYNLIRSGELPERLTIGALERYLKNRLQEDKNRYERGMRVLNAFEGRR